MTFNTVKQWIDRARILLAANVHVPLIDGTDDDPDQLDLTSELVDAWNFGDRLFYETLESTLSQNPYDEATRFVVLLACYQLMTLHVIEKEEEVEQKRIEFGEQLAYFVKLRDVDTCATLRDIRWEITNACAIADFSRALALCEQLQKHMEPAEYHNIAGQFHFLWALLHTWDIEDPLAHWDLPIGPAPRGTRRFRNMMSASFLHTAGVNKVPQRETISEDDKDHLRDAIKHLERTSTLRHRPATRFMLARSYGDIGDHHNAALNYQWMVQNQRYLFTACAKEAGLFWEDDDAGFFLSNIYDCLINQYEQDGDLDNAIKSADDWITAFPSQAGTHERMARLFQAKAEYQSAYEWLRKEADRNPKFGDDPNVSIALALGIMAKTNKIDEAIAAIAEKPTDDHRRVRKILEEYWPVYRHLGPESQERWATGTWLRDSGIPHAAGLASHSFAWVAERELRTTLIDRFRTTVSADLINTDHKESEVLQQYFRGRTRLPLGPMLRTIEISARSQAPLLRALHEWLRREKPSLVALIQRIGTDKMIRLRNREDHADLHTIKDADASLMAATCRELLRLLH